MASRRVTHVNRSIRSSPQTHNTARGNVLFYLEYAPGKSPGGAIGKRRVGELSRERGDYTRKLVTVHYRRLTVYQPASIPPLYPSI